MSKREKIILSLMAVAIVYGGYLFLFQGSKGGPATSTVMMENNRHELDNLVQQTAKELSQENLSAAENRVVAQAEAAWLRPDLFLTRMLNFGEKTDGKKSPWADKYIYSGFVQVGTKKMAIINGLEYKTGDVIDLDGFTLQAITPTKVVLEGTVKAADASDGTPPGSITVTVPLAE